MEEKKQRTFRNVLSAIAVAANLLSTPTNAQTQSSPSAIEASQPQDNKTEQLKKYAKELIVRLSESEITPDKLAMNNSTGKHFSGSIVNGNFTVAELYRSKEANSKELGGLVRKEMIKYYKGFTIFLSSNEQYIVATLMSDPNNELPSPLLDIPNVEYPHERIILIVDSKSGLISKLSIDGAMVEDFCSAFGFKKEDINSGEIFNGTNYTFRNEDLENTSVQDLAQQVLSLFSVDN